MGLHVAAGGALIDIHTMSMLNRRIATYPVVHYLYIFTCCRNDPSCGPVRPGSRKKNNDTDECAARMLQRPPGPFFQPLSAEDKRPLLASVLGFDLNDPSLESTLLGWADGGFVARWNAARLIGRTLDPRLLFADVQPAFRELMRRLAVAWPRQRSA